MFIVLHRESSHTCKFDCILFTVNLFLIIIIIIINVNNIILPYQC